MTKLRTHYDNLKVARDAPDAVIRAAYKVLVQKYHPDKNPGDERAARVMKIINQSYDVLSDPQRRREHDAWIKAQEQPAQDDEFVEPATRESASAPKADKADGMNEAAFDARMNDFFKQLAPSNKFHDRVLKTLLMNNRLILSPKASPQQRWHTFRKDDGTAAAILHAGDIDNDAIRKIVREEIVPEIAPQWVKQSLSDRLNGYKRLIFFALLGGGFWLWNALTPDKPPPPGPKPYQATAPAETDAQAAADAAADAAVADMATNAAAEATTGAAVKTTKYERPATSPNGSPWPTRAAYVRGYPVGNSSGHSKVTIDNGRNNADVFVKLVALDGATAYPVRQFYIPAHGQFTMNKVTPGRYDIRYMDLDSGSLSRSESFDADEHLTYDGIEYSTHTLTLYKVANGNMQTYPLAADEF